MWLRNLWQPHTKFRLSHNLYCFCMEKESKSTPAPPSLHVKLPQTDWAHIEHRTLKKSRCVVCFFYKHIQILDIQCISKSSVLSEITKEGWYKTNKKMKKYGLPVSFCLVLTNTAEVNFFLYLYLQAFSWPFKINMKQTSHLCFSNTVRGDIYTLNRLSIH